MVVVVVVVLPKRAACESGHMADGPLHQAQNQAILVAVGRGKGLGRPLVQSSTALAGAERRI